MARYVPPASGAVNHYGSSRHRFLGGNTSHGTYIRSGSSRDPGSQYNVATEDEQPWAMERVYVKHNFQVSHGRV
jgi:hypothetical protein